MPMLSLSSKVTIPEGVLFREIEGEAVILNMANGIYYGLDTLGTRIWHLIRETGRLESIAGRLVKEYEVDENRCRKDLLKLVKQLEKNELLEVA